MIYNSIYQHSESSKNVPAAQTTFPSQNRGSLQTAENVTPSAKSLSNPVFPFLSSISSAETGSLKMLSIANWTTYHTEVEIYLLKCRNVIIFVHQENKEANRGNSYNKSRLKLLLKFIISLIPGLGVSMFVILSLLLYTNILITLQCRYMAEISPI